MSRLIALLCSGLLLVGCASSNEDSLSQYSKADINFAEMMIPHHEQALEMVALAQTNTTNPDILALAEQIRGAQEPEIVLMKSWPGVDASTHMGHTMSGMLSESEIEKLGAARGAEFDRLFLEGMIKHHEGAIEMAKEVVDSKNQSVMKLAEWIVTVQALEIDTMKELLSKK
ncbi:MAG: DUF305 domain-containing protein [Candidatus Nanopelagicaceae bacterium]|jgi:uncharacterized protein (DUF305 family)|nr:DUF305 domain-containing protein [Actinomycetota bacterium]